MPGFDDYALSMKARDAIEDLIKKVIEKERPKYRYATVESVDAANKKVMVTFNGEDDPVPVQMGTSKGIKVGSQVRIAGVHGDRYVENQGGGLGSAVIDVGEGAVLTGFTKSFWPGDSSLLESVSGTLEVPGTTDTHASIHKNGAIIGLGLTIPAGQRIATAPVNVTFGPTDYWQMFVNTPGANAQGLTYFGKFT